MVAKGRKKIVKKVKKVSKAVKTNEAGEPYVCEPIAAKE